MQTAPASVRRARPLLGTFVEMTVTDAAHSAIDAALEAAFGAVAAVHRLMSFHDPDSDVARLNREAAATDVTVDAWTYQVLETAVDLHRRSAGAFDIAVAPVLQTLGLLPRDGRSAIAMPGWTSEPIELFPDRRVRFRDPGVRIDLGGIAKGFAVDRAIDALRKHGIAGGLVNAGGDLAAFGPDCQAIEVRYPRDRACALCRVEVRNEALASSGARCDPLHSADALGTSVIDPRTRKPVEAVEGATVRARSCLIADALTKVVMTRGEAALAALDHYDAGALVVYANGEIRATANWQEVDFFAA